MEQQMKVTVDALNEIMRQTLADRDEIARLRKALEIAADGFRDCGAEDLEDMCRAVIVKAIGGK
jgi:hypothetical protein